MNTLHARNAAVCAGFCKASSHEPEQSVAVVDSCSCHTQVIRSGLAFTTSLKGPSVIEPRPPQPTSYVVVSDLNVAGGQVIFPDDGCLSSVTHAELASPACDGS